jgi:hypothetical protein
MLYDFGSLGLLLKRLIAKDKLNPNGRSLSPEVLR